MTLATEDHDRFVETITAAMNDDLRFLGLLAGGSLVQGGYDEYSDLDLVLVVADDAYEAVLADRHRFASQLGDLLAAFSGDFVGEPRLLICLYGRLPLHVDLKFVALAALDNLIERPVILWRRSPDLDARLAAAKVEWPNLPADWFEERFWTWIHYAAAKVGRGELFEATGMLAFLRERVFGPLIHQQEGRPQRGVRRLEALSPTWSQRLAQTVPRQDRESVLGCLRASVELYRDLRGPLSAGPSAAESVVTAYLARISKM